MFTMDSTPLEPHGVLEHISESDVLSVADTADVTLRDVDEEGALNQPYSPTALSSDTDALSQALEGIPVGGELSLDMDNISNSDAVVGGSWADETEAVEPFSAPIGPIARTESVPPPSAATAQPPPANNDRLEGRVRGLEREVSHLKDVLARFELIMNQTMGRTDDALRDISTYQAKSRNVTNDLRAQMAGVAHILGKPNLQEAVKTTTAEAKAMPAFRTNSSFRAGGGRAQGGNDEEQQSYAPQAAAPLYSVQASDGGGWQQRGGGGGGGYRGNNNNNNYRGRGAGRGGGGGGRRSYE